MGAWGYCFLSNDTVQDELMVFNNLSSSGQVIYFNNLKDKAKLESVDFKKSEDHLPLEYSEEEFLDLLESLVDPEQDTTYRNIYLGFIQDFINNKRYPLLNSEVLAAALTYLQQLAHKNLLLSYKNPSLRFDEIYKLRKDILKLL